MNKLTKWWWSGKWFCIDLPANSIKCSRFSTDLEQPNTTNTSSALYLFIRYVRFLYESASTYSICWWFIDSFGIRYENHGPSLLLINKNGDTDTHTHREIHRLIRQRMHMECHAQCTSHIHRSFACSARNQIRTWKIDAVSMKRFVI